MLACARNTRARATCHEVALDIVELLRKTLLSGVLCGALDLVVVVVQTGNVAASELGDLTSRPTDTTANIQDLHALLNADAVREVVLVAGNSLVEGLALGEAAEVERLAPSILVEIGSEVVVAATSAGGLVFVQKAYCRVNVAYSATLASRCSGVSSLAALLSQCLKYSSTAAFLAWEPLENMAEIPPRACADLPCMALLKAASREWSSRSRFDAVDEETMLKVRLRHGGDNRP